MTVLEIPHAAWGPFWESPELLADLLAFLRDRDLITTVDDCIAVTEKPWQWQAEFDEMVALGATSCSPRRVNDRAADPQETEPPHECPRD